jgi:hypothetical protein
MGHAQAGRPGGLDLDAGLVANDIERLAPRLHTLGELE